MSKIKIKIDSNESNINICFFKMVNAYNAYTVFRIISQNHEQVKTVFIDRNIPFHFAFRIWIINQ